MYRVEYDGAVTHVENRDEAIRTAQSLTKNTGGRAIVSDADGLIKMVYRAGLLDVFQFESEVTRSRK